MKRPLLWLIPVLLLALASCETDVDVNAPEQPILAIYGILDPTTTTQYVRVSEGYLTEEDAVAFAAVNDLSLPTANVYMTRKVNDFQTDTLRFQPVDTTKEPGEFAQNYTVFASDAEVIAGETYTLNVELNDPQVLRATATTTIPYESNLFEPRDSTLVLGNQWDWSEVNFATNTPLELLWRKSAKSGAEDKQIASAYEISAYLRYGIRSQAGDTTFYAPTAYGPIGPISESRCVSGNDASLCYQINGPNVLSQWTTRFPDPGDGKLVFRDNFRSKAVWFEIAALDEQLLNYQQVNNPAFEDFSTVSFEYTNIELAGDGIGVGVFGSRNKEVQYIRLAQCAQFNLGLNGQNQQPGCLDVFAD